MFCGPFCLNPLCFAFKFCLQFLLLFFSFNVLSHSLVQSLTNGNLIQLALYIFWATAWSERKIFVDFLSMFKFDISFLN